MKKIFLICTIILLTSACGAVGTSTEAQVTPSSTPMPSANPTATTVWFPATATSTPFPTPIVTPTEDMRPKTGRILLEDNFTVEDEWTLTKSQSGSVAYGKSELTIAIGETNAYLFSIREEPILTDFYLEITAAPSMCRGLDEYGVLFRVSPNIDYYRFSLSCNGQVRLDRVIGGQASSPQPWLLSGAVPPGAPSSSHISIAAVGSNLDFFVNGQYQFSIKDPLLDSGGVGVFARSANKMAVTVNFSDLVVYKVLP